MILKVYGFVVFVGSCIWAFVMFGGLCGFSGLRGFAGLRGVWGFARV